MNENENFPDDAQGIRQNDENDLEEYPGYGEPSNRRISDESVRASAMSALESLRAHLPSLRNFLAANSREKLLNGLDETEDLLDRASQRLEAPPYAVSIFFSARRITEDAARHITDNDGEIIFWADQVRELLRETLTPETNFDTLIAKLLNLAMSLESRLDERFSLIGEYQG